MVDGEQMTELAGPVVDHHGLAVLTAEDCWERIVATPIGRIAFVDAGEPLILPVTHGVHRHSIVFRSGIGTKLDTAEMAKPLAFEADQWNAEDRTGWSVLARGVADTVLDDELIGELDALGVLPWLEEAADGTWVRLRVDEISGRELR